MLLSSCSCGRALFLVGPVSRLRRQGQRPLLLLPSHSHQLHHHRVKAVPRCTSLYLFYLIYTSVHSSVRSRRDHQAQVCDRTRNDIISCLSTQSGNSRCTASIRIAMVAQQGTTTSQADSWIKPTLFQGTSQQEEWPLFIISSQAQPPKGKC